MRAKMGRNYRIDRQLEVHYRIGPILSMLYRLGAFDSFYYYCVLPLVLDKFRGKYMDRVGSVK
jgi:hypothetical protein